MTFGIWVSETVDFTSLESSNTWPCHQDIWLARLGILHCSLWGGQSIIFPVTRVQGVRSEVKLTQLV